MDFSFPNLKSMKKEMLELEKRMGEIEKEATKDFKMNRRSVGGSDKGATYSVQQSQVYVEKSDGSGKPHVVKQSYMARSGPGGVKEMKQVVSDSERGRKMCVGRALGEKAHVLRKEENARGIPVEEHEDLYNIDDDSEELKRFHEEWKRQQGHLPSVSLGNKSLQKENKKYLTKK